MQTIRTRYQRSDGSWSHCILAGEKIEGVLDKMIWQHFDQEHVEAVQDWLSQRLVAHDALMSFLGEDADTFRDAISPKK